MKIEEELMAKAAKQMKLGCAAWAFVLLCLVAYAFWESL